MDARHVGTLHLLYFTCCSFLSARSAGGLEVQRCPGDRQKNALNVLSTQIVMGASGREVGR